MKIRYRHYKPGDDEQLVDVFNRAFQMNGGGFIRTAKVVHWRYMESPGFEPEQIQIAEDVDKKKIVGAVYANMVEMVPINGKRYLVADINDVSCDPDYTGNGIARTLMNMAIYFMKEKRCDLSLLVAAYNGFPRKRIYLKLGYEDIERSKVFIHFPNVMNLVRDVPIISSIAVPLIFNSLTTRLINRVRFKNNSFFKDVTYQINHNKKHVEFMNAINSIMPKYYDGFVPYSKERMHWARMQSPVKRLRPTYIVMKKNKEIIGGATITHQNMYSFKFGIKIRMGILHELFIDKTKFNNKRELHFGYMYLIDKILKAASERLISVLLFHVPNDDFELQRALKGMHFFSSNGSAVMIKKIKDGLDLPKSFKKPLFVPTYVSIGVP